MLKTRCFKHQKNLISVFRPTYREYHDRLPEPVNDIPRSRGRWERGHDLSAAVAGANSAHTGQESAKGRTERHQPTGLPEQLGDGAHLPARPLRRRLEVRH